MHGALVGGYLGLGVGLTSKYALGIQLASLPVDIAVGSTCGAVIAAMKEAEKYRVENDHVLLNEDNRSEFLF